MIIDTKVFNNCVKGTVSQRCTGSCIVLLDFLSGIKVNLIETIIGFINFKSTNPE
jgi:hypothetical protein